MNLSRYNRLGMLCLLAWTLSSHGMALTVEIDNQTHHAINIYTQGRDVTFSPPIARAEQGASLNIDVSTASDSIAAAIRLVQPQVTLVLSSKLGPRVTGCDGFLSQYQCSLTPITGGYHFLIEDKIT